jgi:integrase
MGVRRGLITKNPADHATLPQSAKFEPLNPSNIRNRDHLPRLKRLRLPHVRLHDLRHAHATYLVAASVDHRTVADRLGHASPSFMLATPAHAALAAQQRAAAVANELLMKSGRAWR